MWNACQYINYMESTWKNKKFYIHTSYTDEEFASRKLESSPQFVEEMPQKLAHFDKI